MNHQFKPGDLALIVGAHYRVQNIGKVCELVEHLSPEQVSRWVDPSDGCRVQNAHESSGWLVVGEGIISALGDMGWVLADQQHLMPLRDDFAPAAQKAKAVSS